MNWFKKKKIKCSKYVIKVNDYEITEFCNFIIKEIYRIKTLINETNDPVELESLINKRNVLLNISNQLGFSLYQKEYSKQKDVQNEIQTILASRNNNCYEEVVENKNEEEVEKAQVKNRSAPVEI